MPDISMYIPNYDTQNWHFYTLQLVIEKFLHLNKWTNQSKFNKNPNVVKPTLLQDFGD